MERVEAEGEKGVCVCVYNSKKARAGIFVCLKTPALDPTNNYKRT